MQPWLRRDASQWMALGQALATANRRQACGRPCTHPDGMVLGRWPSAGCPAAGCQAAWCGLLLGHCCWPAGDWPPTCLCVQRRAALCCWPGAACACAAPTTHEKRSRRVMADGFPVPVPVPALLVPVPVPVPWRPGAGAPGRGFRGRLVARRRAPTAAACLHFR